MKDGLMEASVENVAPACRMLKELNACEVFSHCISEKPTKGTD
ncbi:hypothetical protein BDD14_4077 [Edaphobacter modestus]|uniref:Uncharacterized protein n=1 Tax=Edaphobacter modestus TaxID=388466 RepID=A0A4Q7YXB6_9BACT|nr:hypothetical protein BDD14_4077 [Edaphobacter modestus]